MKNETRLIKMLMSAYKAGKEPTGVICGCDPNSIVGDPTTLTVGKVYSLETPFGIIKINRDRRLKDKEFVLIYE
jgi:hypothetical protein